MTSYATRVPDVIAAHKRSSTRDLSVTFRFKMEPHDTDFSFRNHEGLCAIERSADHEGHESIATFGDACVTCLAQAVRGKTACWERLAAWRRKACNR
jgi:hypothetical protein